MTQPVSFHGSCNCGNLELAFETRLQADQLSVRECSCSFCRGHGARSITDPEGALKITIRDPNYLIRYRFGLKTADFLICGRCGVYIGAVMEAGNRSFAVVNLNTLDDAAGFRQSPVAVSYDGETEEERIARRKAKWTPVISVVEG